MPKKYKDLKEEYKKVDLFLKFKNNTPKTIKIRFWDFDKRSNGSLFNAEVIEEDGIVVDKIVSIWSYDCKEELKKLLKSKNKNRDTVSLKFTKTEKDMEDVFIVELI